MVAVSPTICWRSVVSSVGNTKLYCINVHFNNLASSKGWVCNHFWELIDCIIMVSVTDDSLLGIVPGLLLPKVIVMGKSTNFIATIVFFRTSFCNFQECYLILCFFYKHESCGQCTSCREGMLNMLNRMVEDRAWHRIEVNTWIHACLPVSSSSSSVYSRLNTTNKLNGR